MVDANSNPYTSKEAWTRTLLQALNGPDSDVEPTFLKLYTRDTTITLDGKSYTLESFLTHVMQLRSIAVDFELNSHCFLRDGNLFAEKHTLAGTMREGGARVEVEGYIFGEIDESGKAGWVDEQTRTLEA
ncbi:hypothetical protein B0T18DRAFT_401138 [Schizothecium vesticola]|uniref:SnoaL-like domain-containing protein n=1 Tax=Schizothecium vesticola TaxID=314040 RepID=A0AA40K9Y9_9PEZI|nr:hypothetical protein B0T18DRAFT_401138 [Schizothecium vesticola]